MKLTISIDMDSDAFKKKVGRKKFADCAKTRGKEVAEILLNMARKCEDQGVDIHTRLPGIDAHGKKVGLLKVENG